MGQDFRFSQKGPNIRYNGSKQPVPYNGSPCTILTGQHLCSIKLCIKCGETSQKFYSIQFCRQCRANFEIPYNVRSVQWDSWKVREPRIDFYRLLIVPP